MVVVVVVVGAERPRWAAGKLQRLELWAGTKLSHPLQPAKIQPAHLVHQVPGGQVGVAHQAARHHCRARAEDCVISAQRQWHTGGSCHEV